MRLGYSLLWYLLLPLVMMRTAWRGLRAAAYLRRWNERLGYGGDLRPGGIWLHAVSVGEVQAAAPLLRRLLERFPERPLMVTTTTPTGSARLRELFGDRVGHAYLPWDLPGATRRFLRRAEPRLALVMETELWPNLFHACAVQGVPLWLINGRLSERSLRGYRRLGTLPQQTLATVVRVLARGEEDARRFVELGAAPERVTVGGDLKFDLELPAAVVETGRVLRKEFGERPVWLAASTHEGEEAELLAAHRILCRRFEQALLIVVPRHPERFDPVAAQIEADGWQLARRSRSAAPRRAQVYLADTMGEMFTLLAACDLCFVGGSLVPVGGHNLLEPAALGKPVLIGPHSFHFAEAVARFRAADALTEVTSAASLAAALVTLCEEPSRALGMGARGALLVEGGRGATSRLLAEIEAAWRKASL